MKENKTIELKQPETFTDSLTAVLKMGAKKLLQEALELKISEHLELFKHLKTQAGKQRVVRNGTLPEREILTGIGSVAVKAPRARDLVRAEDQITFTSKILPPYLRKTKSLEELIPWLYLKGISTGDFSEALAALVGKDASGLSAKTICRLKERWKEEYVDWSKRSLNKKRYVYFWVDGVYSNVRMDAKQCILVIIGATESGKKELVAIEGGFRESEISWKGLLTNLKLRGMETGPKLAIGDGAMGFWKAL